MTIERIRPIRYIPTEVDTPVRSALRRRKAAVIPPFSFIGELEAGQSGYWSPTSTMILESMSVVAGGPGTGACALLVWRKEPQIFTDIEDTYVGGATLPTDGTKVIASLNNTMVTPHDKIYITVMNTSEHPSVVVQMVGVVVV